MSKSTVVGIVVVIIVLAGGGAIWAAHDNKDDTKTTDTTQTSTTTNTTPTDNTPSEARGVNIENFAFSPADITISKGTTIQWMNKDSTAHTVTETDGKTGPDSSQLAPGKTYSFTYNTVGTFKYHCSIHSEMTGTVTVTE